MRLSKRLKVKISYHSYSSYLQELEPRIQEAGQRLLEKLHADDQDIEDIMNRIKIDEVRLKFFTSAIFHLFSALI